jgi:methylglutaconyl-CoA hydratase
MSSSAEVLEVSIEGPVARVYLNRPEVRNAFNEVMVAELQATFSRLGSDPHLRVIVLGAHGKSFCAGADLNWMRQMASNTWEANRQDAQALADMFWTLYSCPIPIIGRLQGDCFAGGVGLACICDMSVAQEDIHFCLSEVKLGLIPATISPYVISAMGERAARRYFITAEKFNARQGQGFGVVHEVVNADELDNQVNHWVQALVHNSPQAVRASKKLIRDIIHTPMTADLRAETARRIADARASDEARDALKKFLDKKSP